MSLILEALKKSEAERRLGRAPGLLDPAPAARGRGGWRAWHFVLGFALLAAVAALAYRGGQQRTQPVIPPPISATASPSAVEAPDRQPEAEPTEPAASQPAPPGVQPTASAAPSLPAAPADSGFTSIERESVPQPVQLLPPPPTAVPAPAAPVSAPRPAASAEINPAESAPAAAPITAPAEPPIPLLSSLGPEARGQLPPLKVSMHVFAKAPEDRVLILDGRRLREGDQIDPRLRLLEIRSDGSVLELDGRRLLLPRP